jgi:lipopolysaccharide/colanic/teichoic acid biosynthesis glycosyltransferase
MAIDTGGISVIPAEMYPGAITVAKKRSLADKAIVEKWPAPLPPWYDLTKQMLDPVLALGALFALAPLFLVVAILIKVTSPGPVFYVQERIGKGGKPFRIFKFRSMYLNAEPECPLLSSACDPRVTKWGRLMRRMRLDELPQFFNVLIGDMSLIGPRPERQYYIDQIVRVAPHYKHLLRMKPGITSLGQVKFGYAENVPEMVERLQYDIQYLQKVSPAVDLRILLHTVITILQGRGQ